jgi:hypothetical protein
MNTVIHLLLDNCAADTVKKTVIVGSIYLQDMAIPGYLPSELFKQLDEVSLRAIVCQRCHFLRFYDTALNVIVSPDDYPKLMAHLKDIVALIVLMVDLLDFPCSMWPGIVDIVGKCSLPYNN